MTAVNGIPQPATSDDNDGGYDRAAEEIVLAGGLWGGSNVDELRGLVSEDFTPGRHQHIHTAILTVADRDPTAVNASTVLAELPPTRQAQYGHYLLTLYQRGTGDIRHYVDRIVEASRRRDSLSQAVRITQLLHSEPGEHRDQHLQRAITALTSTLAGQRHGGRHVRATAASAHTIRAARWLMDKRIPAGAITLLTGREGIGKSTTSYDIIARLTRGELDGTYTGTPTGVGIVASEDAWPEVIAPRLRAARADLERVFEIDAAPDEGGSTHLSLPGDLDRLALTCHERDIALLVLDPLMSVIPAGVDTHKDREVRRALEPLAKWSATTGVAILGLIHVNKSTTTDPLNSIMASRAFSAVARSVLYCITDPEEEHADRYLFGHVKSNFGPKQPALAYRITEVTFDTDTDEKIITSRVQWMGEDTRSISSLMEPPRRGRPTGELTARILEVMADHTGIVPAKAITDALSDVKPNTVRATLRRMVERGQLMSRIHGNYTLPLSLSSDSDTAK